MEVTRYIQSSPIASNMKSFDKLEKYPMLVAFIAAVGMFLVGLIDYFVPFEVSIIVLYVIPVGFAAWLIGKWMGVLFAVLAGGVWLISDLLSGHQFSIPALVYWNALIRLSLFALIAYFMGGMRELLKRVSEAALTDTLTGISNSRDFTAHLQDEISRCRRSNSVFTLVYLDLDNFKTVNDTQGHTAGDELLRTVAHQMRSHLRAIDQVARLGGDEFALLLVGAGEKQAHSVLNKLRSRLQDAMQTRAWPVTFSIGAVTYLKAPDSTDRAIQYADNAMYQIKKGGKNSIRVVVYDDVATAVS